MPPNTPTKEEQVEGKARVGFTGEENMVLPKASGDEHGRRKGGRYGGREGGRGGGGLGLLGFVT